jgi:flagellar protein FlaG
MELGSINKLGNNKAPFVDTSTIHTNRQTSETYSVIGESEKSYTPQTIQKAVDSVNEWLRTTNSHLKFTLHEKLNEYYVQIIDNKTNEVIREIPPKKLLDMYADIQAKLGILVDEKR